MNAAGDRAGVKYWNRQWMTGDLPPPVDPAGASIWNHVNLRFHAWFAEQLGETGTRGKRLLEIGCARSPWLTYFARQYGFDITGIDYSDDGVRLARALLARDGIAGDIVHADMFDPPAELIAAFDVVTSFGVMEHFDDTARALAAASRFLRPGGLLLTEVPNLVGLNGWLQKLLDRRVYDLHVALDCERLRAAHETSGLEVLRCDYVVLTQFGACNVNLLEPSVRRTVAERFLFGLKVASSVMWRLENRLHLRPGRLTAGYLLTAARHT